MALPTTRILSNRGSGFSQAHVVHQQMREDSLVAAACNDMGPAWSRQEALDQRDGDTDGNLENAVEAASHDIGQARCAAAFCLASVSKYVIISQHTEYLSSAANC